MAAKAAKTTFGAEVRKLRLIAGMSLRHLARRVGISPVYLSDIENNRKPAPSSDILQSMIATLHADYDEFMRLAVKSIEEYGCVARKPRMSEQLSADEYILIIQKKQSLDPEAFVSWLHSTAVVATREERKVRQSIRRVVVSRLLKPQQTLPALGTVSVVRGDGEALLASALKPVPINHYEGQSEKDAVEIFVDTCCREWRSLKSDFVRSRYLAALEQRYYTMYPIALTYVCAVES